MAKKLSLKTELKRLQKVAQVTSETPTDSMAIHHIATVNGSQVAIKELGFTGEIDMIKTIIKGQVNYWNRVKFAIEATAKIV